MTINIQSIQNDYYGLVSEYADMFISDYLEEIIDRAKEGSDVYSYLRDTVHEYLDGAFIYVDLLEAAHIIEYSDNVENDSGLWEGQEPRNAIVTQAFFTMEADLLDSVSVSLSTHLRNKAEEIANDVAELEETIEERDEQGADENKTQELIETVEEMKEEAENLEMAADEL